MMPREKWSDERLDDLNKKIDGSFERVEKKIDALGNQVRDLDKRFVKLETRMDGLGSKVDEGFARLEKANRVLLGGLIGIIATLIGGFVSL